jgi:hypothetical protein
MGGNYKNHDVSSSPFLENFARRIITLRLERLFGRRQAAHSKVGVFVPGPDFDLAATAGLESLFAEVPGPGG